MVYDVIIIGGGQSGLAVGYFLRRTGLNYLILDAENHAGGAWQHYWPSLQLFSPAQWSSLPGIPMPGGTEHYPTQQEAVDYFEHYESKYKLNIERPVKVESMDFENGIYQINTSAGQYQSKTIVGATGSFTNPIVPKITGIESFEGKVLHASEYKLPDGFKGHKVAIIGEGNSGAQILAEVSKTAETYWITKKPPEFLPDHVDGQYLFDAATQLYEAKKRGRSSIPPSLGEIVMVPALKEARQRGVLNHYSEIDHFTKDGAELMDGAELQFDAAIFCTGYVSELRFLKNLPVTIRHHKIPTYGTKSRELPGLWMVGYGSWTGFASATVIGVGRSAKTTVAEIIEYVRELDS